MVPVIRALKGLTRCWLAVTAATAITAVPALSQSNRPATAPVAANLSLSKPTLMEGEPVVLNFEVVNASNKDGEFVLGYFQKEWLTIRLEDSTGKPIPTLAGPRWIDPRLSGTASVGDVFLQPNMRRKGSLLLNRWFAPLTPGAYSLKIAARLPYALGEPNDNDLYVKARNKESVLSKEWTLRLTVTEANPRAMRKTAAALKESVLRESLLLDQGRGNENQWEDDLAALFTLPPAVAHSIQRSLITDPRMSERGLRALYHQLANYGTTAVADFLAVATWRYRHRDARNALLVMHAYSTDPLLKERIRQMFADHNDTMTGMISNLG